MAELSDMRVLIAGADPAAIEHLQHTLAQEGLSDVRATRDAAAIVHLCATQHPDLVMIDLDMPELSARHVIGGVGQLVDLFESPPVLALVDDTVAGRRVALELGAFDVVSKPVDEAELRIRVHHALQRRHLQYELRDRNAALTDAVLERTADLETVRLESLSVIASMAEYHDDDTFQHTQRVGVTAALIARALGLNDSLVNTIRDAAPLHDIGKVGISRRILLKPSGLTPAEWTHMTRHVEIGARILAPARSPVFRLAADIARTHHERWDGQGYLTGLIGEDIPLAGRITAVADVFDVLTHERPYNRAWERERALAEIQQQAGRQFDPVVAAAFATIDLQAWDELVAAEETRHAA